MFERLISYLNSGNERSIKAKKNIILSFANKLIAIIVSLAIVPVTINYLDAEQYGIWLTLSSIVAWISFFDIGLGHGFRNRFAQSKAEGKDDLARKYVSTTYFAMTIIFGIALLIFEVINPYINWASLLNISPDYQGILSSVVSIILVGVCCSFVANISTIMLSADQRPAYSSIVSTIGQVIALVVIVCLTLSSKHNMKYIAYALSWSPAIVTVLFSIYLFRNNYQAYSPSVRSIDFSLLGDIVNLGVKFFVIQISMILIFQVVNIILSRVLGPSSVTEYNVTYKYFSVTLMILNIILSPYWSAFTDAYTHHDYSWMNSIHRKLTKVWLSLTFVSIIMLLVSPIAFKIWLNGSVKIPIITSICMFIYITVISFSNIYMILLNGIGKVLLQMIIYLGCAMFAIPTSMLLCRSFGIPGILIVLSSVYGIQAVFAKIQLKKLLSRTASGIWDK